MDKQLIDNAHEIWAAAQLLPGEGIEDGANRIAAILERLASEVCSAQNAECERQDGLSLTGATQKEAQAQDTILCHHEAYQGSCIHCDVEIKNGRPIYAAPQPPAPCPKCEESRQTINWLSQERGKLQAKVAELEAEAAENCRIIGMSSEREARHLAAISELERECNGLAARIGEELNVENEALKVSVSEQAALIEKCEKAIIDALKTTYSDKLASDFRNVLAAIAAQKDAS